MTEQDTRSEEQIPHWLETLAASLMLAASIMNVYAGNFLEATLFAVGSVMMTFVAFDKYRKQAHV